MSEDKDEMCINCKYYAEFEGVCCNYKSKYVADFTDANDYCDCYERRTDNAE